MDLLPCLELDCPSDLDEADAKLTDGANMVHVFRPDVSIESFRHYVDVIWDSYLPDSLKLDFRQYPAIHTNYSWSNCTI